MRHANKNQPESVGSPLAEGLAELGLSLSSAIQQRLHDYLLLIDKWNRVYNLTAVRDPQEMLTVHLLDSLSILPYVSARSLLDVGSGAGLPGIPLALARPDMHVTLLDSNQKKATFLRQAAIELGLTNTTVIGERIEDWHAESRFEWVVSRAFSSLPEFLEIAGRHCAANGTLAAMKGAYPDAELAQLPPGFRLRQVISLEVPGLNRARHLVLLDPLQ